MVGRGTPTRKRKVEELDDGDGARKLSREEKQAARDRARQAMTQSTTTTTSSTTKSKKPVAANKSPKRRKVEPTAATAGGPTRPPVGTSTSSKQSKKQEQQEARARAAAWGAQTSPKATAITATATAVTSKVKVKAIPKTKPTPKVRNATNKTSTKSSNTKSNTKSTRSKSMSRPPGLQQVMAPRHANLSKNVPVPTPGLVRQVSKEQTQTTRVVSQLIRTATNPRPSAAVQQRVEPLQEWVVVPPHNEPDIKKWRLPMVAIPFVAVSAAVVVLSFHYTMTYRHGMLMWL